MSDIPYCFLNDWKVSNCVLFLFSHFLISLIICLFFQLIQKPSFHFIYFQYDLFSILPISLNIFIISFLLLTLGLIFIYIYFMQWCLDHWFRYILFPISADQGIFGFQIILNQRRSNSQITLRTVTSFIFSLLSSFSRFFADLS